MSTVWIIDDEPSICWALKKNLEVEKHDVHVYSTAEPAIAAVGRGRNPDLVLLDIRLPGMDGLKALSAFKEKIPGLPVIIMTAFGDLETAVSAVQGKAFEYLTKPFDLDVALQTVRRGLYQSQLRLASTSEAIGVTRSGLLLGQSPAMQSVYKQIAIAAKSDLTVLIEGEQGTGKSLVAAMIHRFSSRHNCPFLPALTIPDRESEFDSELFGERNSDRSVTLTRTGLFELAAGGTVLVEEIGNLSPSTQARLLRAMETREYYGVGDSVAKPLNCRILFTTTLELERLIDDKEIDARLAAQLSIQRISIPALRQHREDIPEMVTSFLNMYPNMKGIKITDRAIQELQQRDWGIGNIRELKQALEKAAIIATGGVIQVEDLPEDRTDLKMGPHVSTRQGLLEDAVRSWVSERLLATGSEKNLLPNDAETTGSLYDDCLTVVEPPLLRSVLDFYHGNRVAAASHLGVHRSTLRQKMRRYDIDPGS
ncbi:MAG: sigma-54-dependent Fis family transcriptional regulator [Planctomycetes bacterium]|nr:sigma-54-dependent Fis family transcriptional regulator [Planctomycetota bacterium]